ncbi:luciferin 4-monooxygenase-like [Rhipicephalus sanguineus]|uniref:luciferin 4-monooxygenase-like n=1 Tax=Rhipicephalus sanguineus TaxID=34632 RepID=UPI0020C4B44B|nr:luciferin 4-monooxygenase-like [Rhipicephalus sanguineus]
MVTTWAVHATGGSTPTATSQADEGRSVPSIMALVVGLMLQASKYLSVVKPGFSKYEKTVATSGQRDVGYYDTSGRLFVTERLKSVIKCLDTKVEPFEVEQCVLELRFVAEVAVLGVPHSVLGEAPAAIVVLRKGWKLDKNDHIAQRIKDHVAERLAVYKGLHGGIVFAEELPKNRRGKVLKCYLMDEFLKLKKTGTFY